MSKQVEPETITVDDAITILDTTAVFVSNALYKKMCDEAEIADESQFRFMEEYGYVAAIPVRRNGVEGWACFQ